VDLEVEDTMHDHARPCKPQLQVTGTRPTYY
jgi:hypothetical protein